MCANEMWLMCLNSCLLWLAEDTSTDIYNEEILYDCTDKSETPEEKETRSALRVV